MATGERDPLRVVIADDSEEQRQLLKALLTTSGFQVVAEAADGDAAVEAVRVMRPDIALLDLSMPVKDGLEATMIIKAEWPEIWVVMLSSHLASEAEDRARAAGVDIYLEKGIDFPELVAALEQLGARDSTDQLELPRRRPRPAPPQSDEFVSFVIHELRTPVAVIEGFASTLASSLEKFDPDAIVKTADAIRRSTRNLTALVDSFRDVRALETGTLTLRLEEADLAGLTEETVEDLRQIAGAHPLSFKATGVVPATIDIVRVRQVLINLVQNAAKFSEREAPIDVGVGAVNGQAAFWVHDDGSGVLEENRSQLFEKYSRFDEHVPGTGLGLFLSRGIARAHGGDLVHLPRDSGGSTFLATFGPTTAPD
jgi:signal transduction histidine kinase